jgi:signal transduction histidine kinase
MVDARLRTVPLFADLPERDLARICADVTERKLGAGEVLFEEGDPGDAAYVVVDGDVEVLMQTGTRDAVVAVRGVGDVIGEGALLRSAPRSATARARADAILLRIPREGVDDLLATSLDAARTLFNALVDRAEESAARMRHGERMAQLGTLSAGVAHELNNPAAAARRSADQLTAALDGLTGAMAQLDGACAELRVTRELVEVAGTRRFEGLAAADAEDALLGWFQQHGIVDGWDLAAELVAAGLDLDAVRPVAEGLEGVGLEAALRLTTGFVTSRSVAGEIAEATGRLSSIVGALRSFSHLDRAPVGDVDVHLGLEDTITLLAHQLRGITVVRDYAADLPRISALGADLNQVWTNLLHNAADALRGAGTRDPVITIRTRREGDDVVVEVEDNGPGIPPDLRDRIFDAFFTTKAVGSGTGLGLQISSRIVVLEHRGELTVDSEPGRTVFRAVLPISGPG